jgi:dodecin
MAKKQADAVYRIVDVVGVSETSWEDAGRNAVKTAAGSLRDLRVAEVTKMDMKVENGKGRRIPHACRAFLQIRGLRPNPRYSQ